MWNTSQFKECHLLEKYCNMAAEIKDSLPPGVDPNNTMKLQLLRKIDSSEDNINMAILIQNEDGLISISDDK